MSLTRTSYLPVKTRNYTEKPKLYSIVLCFSGSFRASYLLSIFKTHKVLIQLSTVKGNRLINKSNTLDQSCPFEDELKQLRCLVIVRAAALRIGTNQQSNIRLLSIHRFTRKVEEEGTQQTVDRWYSVDRIRVAV